MNQYGARPALGSPSERRTSAHLPLVERRIVVVPDLHVPYHRSDAVDIILAACDGKADEIILIGDLLDCYTASSYDKDPGRKESLQDELDEARRLLATLRAEQPAAWIDLCEGNHEDRIRRLLWGKAPALATLRALSVPELLGLDELRVVYHPRSGFKRHGWRFKHGDLVRAKAGYTASAEMEAHRCSGVSGHTHRQGYATRTDKEGVATTWWESGHLCREANAEYVNSPDWQAGLLVLHASPMGIEVEPISL